MTDSNTLPPALPTTTEQAPAQAEQGPSWYIDESTPGLGERPDWMPRKYKTAADVGKAYTELEKKLGAFVGAPEKYDLSTLEIDEEQHIVKEMTSVAKELGMSQEGLNKFLGRIASAQEAESSIHLETEVKKLGPDGERIINEFNNWTKDYLQPAEAEVVKEWVKTADDLKVFNKMMSNSKMSQVPTSHTMAMANGFETLADVKNEMVKNIDRYDKDPTYRADVSNRMSRAYQRNPNG